MLGHALAKSSYVADVELALLEQPPIVNLGQCLAFFWAWRRETLGWEWFERLLRTLIVRERAEDAANVTLLFRATEHVWDLVDRIGEPLRSAYWNKHEPLWFDEISQEGYARGIGCLLEASRTNTAIEAAYRAAHDNRLDPTMALRVLDALRLDDQQGLTTHVNAYKLDYLFAILDNHVEEDRIVELEIAHAERLRILGFRDVARRGARCFFEKIKRSPEYFVDVLRRMQRPEGVNVFDDELGRSTDASAVERKHLGTLIYDWSGYPGDDMPIGEREAALETWCTAVLREASDPKLKRGAVHHLEEILARVDTADDGHWPCLTARRLLESGQIRDVSNARINGRGMLPRGIGEGGKSLRVLAEEYQASANALRGKYPKTAAILDAMARDRQRESERVDEEERREHIEYGESARDAEEPRSRTVEPKPSTALREGLNHIRHIHVENLRCFDTLTIKDIPVDEEHGQCLMLLGANGTGKTTLLRAIAAALLDQQAAGTGIDAMTAPLLLLRNSSLPGKIEITLGEDVFGVQFVPEAGRLKVRPLGKPPTARPWVVGYGCFRGSLLGGNAHAMAPAGDTATLWGEGMGLWPSIQALDELQQRAKEGDSHSKNLMAGATHALTEVLHDIDEVTVESERLAIGGKGVGGKHSALALSDGYLGTMGWVLDMIFRWSSRQQALGKPIKVNFLAEMEGVAIVDDIDLHMHPSWQRKLLKRLQSTFPRMTFVGTTHNPQTILGVRKPEKIQVLRRSFEDPAQIEARAMEVPVGRRADQVLTGGWFGLDSTLDDETLALMDEHQRLLLQPVRDEAELTRLQEEIGSRIYRFIDTSREAYVYGIVTEILREQLPKLQPEEREKARQQLKEMVKARLAARDGKTA